MAATGRKAVRGCWRGWAGIASWEAGGHDPFKGSEVISPFDRWNTLLFATLEGLLNNTLTRGQRNTLRLTSLHLKRCPLGAGARCHASEMPPDFCKGIRENKTKGGTWRCLHRRSGPSRVFLPPALETKRNPQTGPTNETHKRDLFAGWVIQAGLRSEWKLLIWGVKSWLGKSPIVGHYN